MRPIRERRQGLGSLTNGWQEGVAFIIDSQPRDDAVAEPFNKILEGADRGEPSADPHGGWNLQVVVSNERGYFAEEGQSARLIELVHDWLKDQYSMGNERETIRALGFPSPEL